MAAYLSRDKFALHPAISAIVHCRAVFAWVVRGAMPATPAQPFAYLDRAPLSRRAFTLTVALAMSALMILMLLKLGTMVSGPPGRALNPIVVQLLPAAAKTKQTATHSAHATQVKLRIPRPIPLPPTPVPRLNMIMLSHEEFAASDISRLPAAQTQAGPEAGAGASGSNDDSVGQGPHGEKLYNAEWYREPTHAEMATYLPTGLSQVGWAMIACRTIEHYHVDDCQELTEDPPGTGLARALRLASWQFLVRPPRIGGRTMVGAWVRIRFDFTQEKNSG